MLFADERGGEGGERIPWQIALVLNCEGNGWAHVSQRSAHHCLSQI